MEIRPERTIQHADSNEELLEILQNMKTKGIHYYELAFVKSLDSWVIVA